MPSNVRACSTVAFGEVLFKVIIPLFVGWAVAHVICSKPEVPEEPLPPWSVIAKISPFDAKPFDANASTSNTSYPLSSGIETVTLNNL